MDCTTLKEDHLNSVFVKSLIIGLFILQFGHSSFGQHDIRATKETKALYRNLKTIGKTGTMFGHQDAVAYGLNPDTSRWIAEEGRSDVHTILGEHPAVMGFDLGHLELDSPMNLDEVPFGKIKQYIQDQYSRGGVSTISWHPNNPLDYNKTTWDKVEATIPTLLNDKKALKNYKKTSLNKLAKFFKSVKGPNGEAIPLVFRPYHEHTGSWFWWGADFCTPEEYKEFWQMTVKYLTKKKKVHNLIIAYSTDNFRSEEHYLERYPGDEYVDLLGFDSYHRNAPQSNEQFVRNAKRMLGTVKKLGLEKDKPYAVSETGLERVTEADWWTNIILPILEDSQASYILFWRNGRPDHFYAPYPGHSSEEDFKKIAKSGKIIFERGAKNAGLYN